MIKHTVEKPITEHEFNEMPEKKGRVFKVSYFDTVDHIRSYRRFMYKHNLRHFINKKRYAEIKYFVGEIVYEQQDMENK